MPDATTLGERIETEEEKHRYEGDFSPELPPDLSKETFHSEFCFVSLALGIFGLIMPLFSTLAVVIGIGGLMQAHRENVKGKWMAITGISLGFLGIILIIVGIIFSVNFLEDYFFRFGGLETMLGNLEAAFAG